MVIPIISVKKGKPGKRVKTSSNPGLEELNKAVDEAVLVLMEKYNQCHGANGKFCSGNGGGGGGGGGSGGGSATSQASGERGMDEPEPYDTERDKWLNQRVKTPKPPKRAVPNGPGGTFLPDKDGRYPYPINNHARKDLAPLVGKEVSVEYWVENTGGRSIADPSKASRCIKDIKVPGVKEPVHHVWAQGPPPEILNAPWGQKQKATATITAYAKGKHGQPKTIDFSVQFYKNVQNVNKSVEAPLLDADTLLKDLGHLLEKYNQCHGANGRFCSGNGGSGGGGAGGATAQAGGVQSLDDALAGKPIEYDQFGNQIEQKPEIIPVTDGRVVTTIENQLGMSHEEMAPVVKTIDDIAANAKLQDMHQVTFKELDTNVLAQCEGSWWTDDNGKLGWSETIAVNPRAKDYATSRYVEDHMKLQATGQMPWLASANAPDAEKAYKAVLVHEVAHAKMMEHALKSPTGLQNENNPMHGTKTWNKVVTKAHSEGWQGPSQYGRKNLGEMFAESVSLLTIRGSTGHKDVDDYVVRVITE